MIGNLKDFSIVFFLAIVTLLSCCSPVLSFVLPRVTRTSDATIIDLSGNSYAPHNLNKDAYGAIDNPTFNPYVMVYQQQQPKGWSYFFEYPSPSAPAGFPSNRQYDAVDEEEYVDEQLVKQSGSTQVSSAPANQCGRGPTTFPKSLPLISGRISLAAAAPASAVTEAKKGVWPFVVTLKDKAGVLFCAGSLISDTKVLLAAQCLEDLSLFDISGVTVSIGVNSASPLDAQMTRRISKMVLHSKYNAATYVNDIAIITLDSPVVFSRTVGPVCLPPASADPDQYADQDAIILGWGTTDKNTASSSLLQAKVGIVSNSDCRADGDFGRYVSDGNICVSSTDAFTCDGDVGGPVVVNTAANTPGTPAVWTIVGVNSYTKVDCSATGLKTRVSAYVAWINLYMK